MSMGEAIVDALVDGDPEEDDEEETGNVAECMICKKSNNYARMLLCDFCERSYVSLSIPTTEYRI